MAKKDHFVFFSLDEDKADTLANTLGNKTSRAILKFLSSRESTTETEIAKELKLPISTVHYNMKNLLKSNLVKVDEFHYSKKGREVNHYSLAKKYIVIAPEHKESILNKFKSLLSLGALVIASSFAINLFRFIYRGFGSSSSLASQIVTKEVSGELVRQVANEIENSASANNLGDLAFESPDAIVNVTNATIDHATNIIHSITQPSFLSYFPTWFLIGGLFVVIVIVLWRILKEK